MAILYVGIGFMVLIAGRPVYSVFVGTIAFLLGTFLSGWFTLFPPAWNDFFIPLLFAVIGIILAQVFRRWTARVAGFVAGGILLLNLPVALGSGTYWTSPFLFVGAGIVTVILLVFIFDFALIVLTSLMASTLILSYTTIGRLDQGSMFLILTVFGIITQYLIMQYMTPSPD